MFKNKEKLTQSKEEVKENPPQSTEEVGYINMDRRSFEARLRDIPWLQLILVQSDINNAFEVSYIGKNNEQLKVKDVCFKLKKGIKAEQQND